MKIRALFLLCLTAVIASGARASESDMPDLPCANLVTGTWDPGGGLSHPFSFRNHRYSFTVPADGSSLSITLESPGADGAIWLYNPLGQEVDKTWGDRSLTLTADELDAGEYLLIAGTQERGVSSKYKLEVAGMASALTRIPSQILTASGAWDTEGGGLGHPHSFRNHRYTVEVTEQNSMLDIILESTGADGAIWVYNPLGQEIDKTWGDRDLFIVAEAPRKGTYTIIVGTQQRNVLNASYQLNVNGQVANLSRISSQVACADGNIPQGAGLGQPNSTKNDIYTFQVTENNSSIDLIVRSPAYDLAVWVYNPLGQEIGRTWGDRDLFIVEGDLKAGTYKIVCGTQQENEGGPYHLCVVGQLSNFKKQ